MTEQDTTDTIVVFRVWPAREGGDVIALMPHEPETYYAGGRMCDGVVSYQHIGQHGAADYPAVVQVTRPATEAEYAPLKRELEQIGYRVKVAKRAQRRRSA